MFAGVIIRARQAMFMSFTGSGNPFENGVLLLPVFVLNNSCAFSLASNVTTLYTIKDTKAREFC